MTDKPSRPTVELHSEETLMVRVMDISVPEGGVYGVLLRDLIGDHRDRGAFVMPVTLETGAVRRYRIAISEDHADAFLAILLSGRMTPYPPA